MKISKIFLSLVVASVAHAYIPPSDFVMEKVAKSHGKGIYSIEQEVVFRSGDEAQTIKEFWLIQDGETMRMSAKGDGITVGYVYNSGKVFFNEGSGATSRKVGAENLEKYFHARSDKAIADFVFSAKVVSQHPLRPRPKPKAVSQLRVETDPYMRLMRIGDDPTILISNSIDPKESNTAPGIWIDQQTFGVRKIRFQSGAEVSASQYQTLSNDLAMPRLRVVTWNGKSVEIRLTKVNSVAKASDGESFSPNQVNQVPINWGTSSLSSTVREFYERFR